jgi:hypothetical protein
MSKLSQTERIIKYVAEHGSITAKDALKFGVMRLASRMSDIKRKGYTFDTEIITVKNRYGEKCRVARYSNIQPVA